MALLPLAGQRHHVGRLVTFFVDEHDRVLPHSACRGETPDGLYFGTGDAVPADLTAPAAAARRARVEANRSAACETCPSVEAFTTGTCMPVRLEATAERTGDRTHVPRVAEQNRVRDQSRLAVSGPLPPHMT